MASSSEGEDAMDASRGDGIAFRTRTSKARENGAAGNRTKERWEDIQRSWDLVTEGADGSLAGTVEGLLEAGKRKRITKDATPLQRGIIRHLVLIIDLSSAMAEKDLRPTRYLLTLRTAADFITTFFEQNPISQLSLIGMRDGLALRLSDMSGNPAHHLAALAGLRTQDPKGAPSLQNALELARALLGHSPAHGTREVLILYGALLSSDPRNIHDTINSLVRASIRVNVVGLAARIAVCQELCSRTNNVPLNDTSVYGVALDEQHLRELVFQYITPPATTSSTSTTQSNAPTLLEMGFPSRISEVHPTLCACHGNLTRGGYPCSRCKAKVCALPAQCPGCGLQLLQSTHLARSYHHLFPLKAYAEVSWSTARARRADSPACYACLSPFPAVPKDKGRSHTHPSNVNGVNGEGKGAAGAVAEHGDSDRHLQDHRPVGIAAGASESSRYECTTCRRHFCIDCDVLAHEVLHNCAGCLSGAADDS